MSSVTPIESGLAHLPDGIKVKCEGEVCCFSLFLRPVGVVPMGLCFHFNNGDFTMNSLSEFIFMLIVMFSIMVGVSAFIALFQHGYGGFAMICLAVLIKGFLELES
jgi:hypothetical protein